MFLNPSLDGIAPLVDPIAQAGEFFYDLWDAERTDLITIATGVSAWAGSKAGLVVAQATGSAQPSYSTNSFGGGACVTFDGTDDFLSLTLAGQLPAGSVPCEMWALCSNLTADDTRLTIGYGNTAAIAGSRHLGITASKARAAADTAANAPVGTRRVRDGRRFILRGIYASNSVSVNLGHPISGFDGCSVATTLNTVATRLRIGSSTGGAAGSVWLGSIALVAITRPLPPSLARSFWGYLNRRRRE